MDRFIEIKERNREYEKSNLKSNMDRFIVFLTFLCT